MPSNNYGGAYGHLAKLYGKFDAQKKVPDKTYVVAGYHFSRGFQVAIRLGEDGRPIDTCTHKQMNLQYTHAEFGYVALTRLAWCNRATGAPCGQTKGLKPQKLKLDKIEMANPENACSKLKVKALSPAGSGLMRGSLRRPSSAVSGRFGVFPPAPDAQPCVSFLCARALVRLIGG